MTSAVSFCVQICVPQYRGWDQESKLPECSEVPGFPGGILNIVGFKRTSAKLAEAHAFNQNFPCDQRIHCHKDGLQTGGKGSRDKYQGINNYECYFK